MARIVKPYVFAHIIKLLLIIDVHIPIIIANNFDVSVCPLVKARLVAKILFAIFVPKQFVVILFRAAVIAIYERFFVQFRRLKSVYRNRLLLLDKYVVCL